jgi:hypothetical protein
VCTRQVLCRPRTTRSSRPKPNPARPSPQRIAITIPAPPRSYLSRPTVIEVPPRYLQ